MTKTLIASLYDSCYSHECMVMDENFKMRIVNLGKDKLEALDDYVSEWIDKTSERWIKSFIITQTILNQYDHVIVCDNGRIKKLK